MKIMIICPGRLGDILTTLPAVQTIMENHEVGEIVWPILSDYIDNFSGYISQIKFIPLYCDIFDSYRCSLDLIMREQPDRVFDLCFNFPGAELSSKRWVASGLHFDEYRYLISGVSFSAERKVKFQRNTTRERQLLNNCSINIEAPFALINQMSSLGEHEIKSLEKSDINLSQRIYIDSNSSSIFDWTELILRASEIHTAETAFSNLVDLIPYELKAVLHLNLKPRNYYLDGQIGMPKVRREWIIYE